MLPGCLRSKLVASTSALCLLLCGCGGSSNSNSSSGLPQFTIATGNWVIPLSGGATAGGFLTQNGSAISGTLRIIESPCFDPVADELMVTGAVSTDPNAQNALTLSTAPVRGQTLTLVATWVAVKAQTAPPPTKPDNPTAFLSGNATMTGGACAGTSNGGATFIDFSGTWTGFMNGSSGGSQVWSSPVSIVMSQTGPDAEGFFHVSGTVSAPQSPCFTSGTFTASSIAGEMNQVTITMDSAQLVGSATRIAEAIIAIDPTLSNSVSFGLTVQGGSCNGEGVGTSEMTQVGSST